MKRRYVVCSELKKSSTFLRRSFIPDHTNKFGIEDSVILTLMEFKVNNKAENIKIVAEDHTARINNKLPKIMMISDLCPIRFHLLVLAS